MQIYFHSHFFSYLPRVPKLVKGTLFALFLLQVILMRLLIIEKPVQFNTSRPHCVLGCILTNEIIMCIIIVFFQDCFPRLLDVI